ncbi:MAG TPA: DUF167 domain-containing protein [Smithella sp.]|nr:DUF167 domain-containing protein [Smithella sp.]
MISVKESQRGLSFDIHVIPYASRAEIAGIQDGTLKVRVTAPPVEGAANAACIKLLASALGLKKSQMEISTGAKSRRKTVTVKNIGKSELERKILTLVAENRLVEQMSLLEKS